MALLFRSFVVTLPLLSLCGRYKYHLDGTDSDCAQLSNAEPLDSDETEIIFVRHAKSLNNVFTHSMLNNLWATLTVKIAGGGKAGESWDDSWSIFKTGYHRVCHEQQLCGGEDGNSSVTWELSRHSRDCLLHPDGEDATFEFQKTLYHLLPPSYKINGFYTSPLRRTLQTLLAGFSEFMVTSRSAVGLSPWAHERYKSRSDLCNEGSVNAHFLSKYWNHMLEEFSNTSIMPPPHSAINSLQHALWRLGDNWVDMYGSAHPSSIEVGVNKFGSSDPDNMLFYPRSWTGTYTESDGSLKERMVVLRRWLQRLPPGGRYVLVSHGGIGEELFGKKPDNLGVIVARFRKSAVAENGATFFSRVDLAKKLWNCSKIPGWANPDEESEPKGVAHAIRNHKPTKPTSQEMWLGAHGYR